MRAAHGDLQEYTQDLLYQEIQGPLFTYLLPFCLQAWRDDLRGTDREYGAFVDYFYPVLAYRGVFGTYLTPKQTAAVSEFMRQAILEEVDERRGPNWLLALTGYGILLPDMDLLWTAWWSVSTPGRAIAAIRYVSCLMYPDNANPLFC